MIGPTFACPPRGEQRLENISRVCAAGLDAAIDRARVATAQDAPAAWAAVDRRVVDLAATVPYVNPRVTVFVSKRVGNVVSHPMYQTLLDQIWVR
jgi:ABC-type transport system substrate-binding protein